MRTFTKRLALVTGLLFTALICCGIVYIDNVAHYWQFSGGFVRLVVNTNSQAVMTVDTNTQRVGFFSNNTARLFVVSARKPNAVTSGNGTSGATTGQILLRGTDGGDTSGNANAGGAGGPVNITGGDGGVSTGDTNAVGGAGGGLTFATGAGGAPSTGTNNVTGGNGGSWVGAAGSGGNPASPATNTVGGNGGTVQFSAGTGGQPTAGWARKTGNGGSMGFSGGSSLSSTRTNSGNGGSLSFTAGSSGNVTTAPGNPGIAGDITFNAGGGGTGDTNANGGSIYLLGGTGAVAGVTVIGRNLAGLARGGLQVGPLVAGTTATLTNLLSVTAVLDFPSIAAGTVADLSVAFAGAEDGDVVTLGVPLASVTNCMWMGFASNAVVYVRAANGQLVTAQDPGSGTFRIAVKKFR